MLCPKCLGESTVIDVVKNLDDNEVYRKIRCKSCGHTFFSIEYEIEDYATIKKTWNRYHRLNNKEK